MNRTAGMVLFGGLALLYFLFMLPIAYMIVVEFLCGGVTNNSFVAALGKFGILAFILFTIFIPAFLLMYVAYRFAKKRMKDPHLANTRSNAIQQGAVFVRKAKMEEVSSGEIYDSLRKGGWSEEDALAAIELGSDILKDTNHAAGR